MGVSATTLMTEPQKAWVAVLAVVATVIFICIQIYRITKRHMGMQHPSGFSALSAFVRYASTDGKNITYEVFRHIQIKRPCLSYIEHKFNWTGSTPPTCESDLQEIGSVDSIKGENTKSVKLKFKRAKIYNDVEVIHLKMAMDDSDKKSEPFLQQSVLSPVSVISFRVDLLYADTKYFGNKATLSRRETEKGHRATDEILGQYSFDATTKSYYCNVTEPEPGYTYKLSWDRPQF
ncbi:hypothetical protein IAE33_000411 [Pseudomonas sp. S60]|nr:hypothetical protein [Pseudomonas sp. S60]